MAGHPRPPETGALALWCNRFAVSDAGAVQPQRWKACVAGAAHRIGLDALVFDIPASPVVRMCAELEEFADRRLDATVREEGRRLCERMGAGRRSQKSTTWGEFWLFGTETLF